MFIHPKANLFEGSIFNWVDFTALNHRCKAKKQLLIWTMRLFKSMYRWGLSSWIFRSMEQYCHVARGKMSFNLTEKIYWISVKDKTQCMRGSRGWLGGPDTPGKWIACYAEIQECIVYQTHKNQCFMHIIKHWVLVCMSTFSPFLFLSFSVLIKKNRK